MNPKGGVAFRGSFLIDENGVVRHQVVNDLPLGRNVDEMIRMIDALNFHQKNGEVCPAGWEEGDSGMQANPEGVAAYLNLTMQLNCKLVMKNNRISKLCLFYCFYSMRPLHRR